MRLAGTRSRQISCARRLDARTRFDKPPAQLGDTFLALLLMLFLGSTEFGAAVSGGRHGDITGRLNSALKF